MGIPTLITTNTITSSADSTAFTSGIDSTYDEYMFVWTDVHPSNDGPTLGFQVNASGQSGYNEAISSTFWSADLNEAGGGGSINYGASWDMGNETTTQYVNAAVDNDTDSSTSGILHLFSPADTTFVKHFYSRSHSVYNATTAQTDFVSGYVNVAAAIVAVEWKFSLGTIDSGVFQMFGIG